MKKIIKVLPFAAILLLLCSIQPGSMYAQEIKIQDQKCFTKPPAVIKQYSREIITQTELTSDYLYVVRVYVHILRNFDGSNAATTETQMYADLQTMSNFFKPHNICFMLVGFEYIDNTYLNNSMNPGIPDDVTTLASHNKHNDAIDIYVHTGMGDGSGGNSYNIPSDFFSVLQATNFNFYHEMGHCLGLLHTFETAGGTECPDGSNCGSAGDFICDTPADFAGSQNFRPVGSFCTYSGNNTIVCNNLVRFYTPPINNIMSYWAACYTQFTPQQGTRMRTTIANENIVNKCLVPFDASVYAFGGNIFITGEWYLAAKNEINIGTLTQGSIVFLGGGNANKFINAGRKITLRNGTRITPVIGTTRLFINPLCD